MWQSTVSLICLLEVVHDQHRQRRRVRLLHRGGGDTWPRVSSPRCTISSRSPSFNLIICRFIVQPPADARPNQDQGPSGQPQGGAVDGAMEEALSKVLVRTRHADVHLNVKVAGFGQPAISAPVATNPCNWYAPPEVWSGRRPSAPRRRTCTALRC